MVWARVEDGANARIADMPVMVLAKGRDADDGMTVHTLSGSAAAPVPPRLQPHP